MSHHTQSMFDDRDIDALWTKTDSYINERCIKPDQDLDSALASHGRQGLPQISVSEAQGKLLHLLVLTKQATRILEIGTLAGYSTIWLAKAAKQVSPSASVTTLEVWKHHASVARQNIKNADLDQSVSVIVGDARESLRELICAGKKYDFIFLDADKTSYSAYLELIKQAVLPGAVLISDNVVRQGQLSNTSSRNENVVGVQKFLAKLSKDESSETTVIQTVGSKGYDGFAYTVFK